MTPPPVDLLAWERHAWDAGYRCLAGVDEVGRGALAGPLVAAAVCLPASANRHDVSDPGWSAVRDSKTLTPMRRAELARWIVEQGTIVSIAEVPNEELDEIGLAAANRCAMERAVLGLSAWPDMLLIDAATIDLDTPQLGIIDGDALSLSIAAASILAKVHRDAIMTGHHSTFPQYGFARHKGYGVPMHLDALATHGPCALHRHSFGPVTRAAINYGHQTER